MDQLQKLTSAVQKKRQAAQLDEDAKEAKRVQERIKYRDEIYLPGLLTALEDRILKAANEGQYRITVTADADRGALTYMMTNLPDLHWSLINERYVPAYPGSADDGHAYARDGHWDFSAIVSW